jgi:hypothetical protein
LSNKEKNMKRTILSLVLLALIAPLNAEARYAPLSLLDLTGGADAIVTGTIAGVGDADFELKIDNVVYGESADFKKAITVTVQKFKDWACAARWGSYTQGETILVFLKQVDGKLQIMGAGGEGELFIHEGSAYFSRGRSPQGFDSESVDINGTVIHGAKLPLEPLMDAIAGLHQMYTFAPGTSFGQVTVEARESDRSYDEFIAASAIHKVLGEEAHSRLQK